MPGERFQTAGRLINRAAIQLGLGEQQDAWGSSDPNLVQLREFLTTLGQDLALENWRHLHREVTYVTEAGKNIYPAPSGFLTWLDNTGQNLTTRLPPFGPVTPQTWAALRSSQVSFLLNVIFRQHPGEIEILGPVTAGQNLIFSYRSRFWVRSANSTSQDAVGFPLGDQDEATNSGDLILFSPLLVVRGLRLAWLEAKGFDTTAALTAYRRTLDAELSADAPGPTLSLTRPRPTDRYIDGSNLPGQINPEPPVPGGTYSISGSVSGLSDPTTVTVTLSGGAAGSVHPAASGAYSFAGLAPGSYTLTPSRTGYHFAPASRSVTVTGDNVSGQDFAGAADTFTFTISGTVSGLTPQNVVLTLSGIGTTSPSPSGTFSFSDVPPGSYTLTPSRSGYQFSPASRTVTVTSSDVTGQNFTGAPGLFAISGTITGLSDPTSVTLTLSGAGSATTNPDSSGNYSFTGLLNGSYTVTPTRVGRIFTPASLSITIADADRTGQNFVASVAGGLFVMDGSVGSGWGGDPTAVVVALSGDVTANATPNAGGWYFFPDCPPGIYTITPSIPGYYFTPPSRTIELTANQSGLDFVAAAGSETYDLPADRRTVWAPGITGAGETIPNYTTVYATVTDTSGDSVSRIQAQLGGAAEAYNGDGIGRVVKLGPGTFNISAQLFVPTGVVLRGDGVDAGGVMKTTIYYTGTDGNVVTFGHQWVAEETAVSTLAANANKGSNQITLNNVSGFAVGQLVYIDQFTDDSFVWWHPDKHPPGVNRAWYCRDNRPIAQTNRITAINGNTLTLEHPLHMNFKTSLTAQAVYYSRAGWDRADWAGVEDLRTSHAVGTKCNVYFNLAYKCWAKHVEMDNMIGSAVGMEVCCNCEVRDCYIHDTAYPEPGGNGYGIDIRRGASDNLIENNIVIRFDKVINGRSAGGGNVVAYNYMDDGYINSSPSWVETGLQASHYPFTSMMLFEGNYCFNAHSDSTEGNAGWLSFFRNHLSGQRLNSVAGPDGGNILCAGVMRDHHNYNYVGNVLGRPGTDYSSWLQEDEGPWSAGDKAIWRFGHWNEDYSYNDHACITTALRDGNYDYKSQTVQWLGIGGAGSTAKTLPDSFYLSAKPAFFGSNTWPWVDPVGSTKLFVLPAKQRYDEGHPNVL